MRQAVAVHHGARFKSVGDLAQTAFATVEAGARLFGAESRSRHRLHELLVPADRLSYEETLTQARQSRRHTVRGHLGGRRTASRCEDAIADALAAADRLIGEGQGSQSATPSVSSSQSNMR